MAPMMKSLLAALVLATYTSAVPLALDRRAPANMVTETVWTTVDVTTTIYVDGPSPQPQVENAPPAAPAAVTTTTSSPPVAATPAATPAAAPELPAAPAAPVAPVPDAPAAFAAQASPSSTTPVATPVASVPAAPIVEAKTAGASSGGPCEGSSNACTGDVTHYEGGLGACGWNVDTASEMQIALPHGLMGTQSNGNPYCGRSLTIKSPSGGTVKATVGDKCMGCEGQSIDLTDALFKAVVPDGDGRVSNIEWWFD